MNARAVAWTASQVGIVGVVAELALAAAGHYGGYWLAGLAFSAAVAVIGRLCLRLPHGATAPAALPPRIAPPATCPDHPDTELVPVGAPGNAMCPADGGMYELRVVT